MSAKNEDWDVERHKVEFDEYWKLRRKFLRTHKDKFPEDLLVCLAQVFIDVELLGCSYPQRTMDLVKELSQDIPVKYICRIENPKKKLQKTFVEASEAASSKKIKGCVDKTFTVAEESISNILDHISNATNFIDQSPSKKCSKKDKKLDAEENTLPNATKEPASNIVDYNSQSNDVSTFRQYFEELYFEEIQSEKLKTEGEVWLEDQYNPYKDIVLLERPGDSVFTTLEVSAFISGKTLSWHYCQKEKVWECSVNIKSQKLQQKLSCSSSLSQKEARILAADIALEKLRKCCCTVKVNKKLKTEPHFEEMPPKRLKIDEDVSLKDRDNPFRDIVLWERLGDNAFHMLQISARLSGKVLKCNYSKKKNCWDCCMKINSQELSCSTNLSLTKQEARTLAANIALEKLRKYCYTVKVTEGWGIDPVVTAVEIKKESLPNDDWSGFICTEKTLMVDWPGDSFGKSDQGTVELISPIVETQINQQGCDQNIKKMHKIIAICERLLQTDNILECDIVFLDFPKKDRMLIYQIAGKMNLNSCAKDERKLIVSRKVNIWRLVKQLNELGGITEKYELMKPTDEKFASLPASMNI